MLNRLFYNFLFGIIFIIATASVVHAVLGNKYIMDFSNQSEYTMVMKKGDRVDFTINDSNHTIILDEIKPKLVELDVFAFVEKLHNPAYINLSPDKVIKLDFERDGLKDLELELKNLKSDRAVILFRLINETYERTPLDSDKITGEAVKSISNLIFKNVLVYLISVVGIILVVLILFRKRLK